MGPVSKVTVGTATVTGSVANVQAVVTGMAAGFRRCFNKGLVENPSMRGSVTITATLGPKGEVIAASPTKGSGLSGSVFSCVTARVATAQFDPPAGGSATVTIPVKLEVDGP
jgi:hypothetical protein